MKIVRLGRPRRVEKYLDIVDNDEVDVLTVFSRDEERDRLVLELISSRFPCRRLVDKIEILPEPILKDHERSWKRIQVERLARATLGMKQHGATRKRWVELAKKIRPHLESADLLWFGDSDLDHPCEWLVAVSDIGVETPKILGLKETRYKRDRFEELALKRADGVLFPHSGHVDFFKSLYKYVPDNLAWADPNYPASQLVDWLSTQSVEKLSRKDGMCHACILTRTLMGSSGRGNPRNGARYYMLDEIQDLLNAGLVVHLHSAGRGDDGAVPREYIELEKEHENFVIERPLTLIAGSADYLKLAAYDFGVLHPGTTSAQKKLRRFQEINVPNRYFEYMAVGLGALVRKGSLGEMERDLHQSGNGIVWEDAKDLATKIEHWFEGRKESRTILPVGASYKEYASAMADCYRRIRVGEQVTHKEPSVIGTEKRA